MALVKATLKSQIESGLKAIYKAQAAKATQDGAEQEDPNAVIDDMCDKMAKVFSDAIDAYIKSGDIYVKSANIVVTSPHGPCSVTPASPAKVE